MDMSDSTPVTTHLCLVLQNLPKEYHLVALDMPGHGASTTPPASQELTLEFAMEIIKRVCGVACGCLGWHVGVYGGMWV